MIKLLVITILPLFTYTELVIFLFNMSFQHITLIIINFRWLQYYINK